MVLLSLFSGIGGAELAIKKSRWFKEFDTFFYSEVDKYAIKIFEKHYPNAINLGDIRNITASKIIDIILDDDIFIIGGSPCQDLSSIKINGKGLQVESLEEYLKLKNQGYEFEGSSYLFWEMVKIIKGLNPNYYLIENVRIRNKKDLAIFDKIFGKHTYIDSGLISPQSRKRYYWTNFKIDEVKPICNKVCKDVINFKPYKAPNSIINGYYGNKRRIDAITNIKNKCHTLMASMANGNISRYVKNDKNELHRLTPEECEILQGFPIGYTEGVSTSRRLKALGNSFQIDTIVHIINSIKDIDQWNTYYRTIKKS
jgi:site-specific DNA-cytosine methylase